MVLDYDNRIFITENNSNNGEVSSETTFYYHQQGSVVTAVYSGGHILEGHLIATVDENSCLDMRYHHINRDGELKCGRCRSTPELLSDGRLRMHEEWQWLCDDQTSGQSTLIELRDQG